MNITNAMGSAVSGMNAAGVRMDVTAHNIANINTDDFRDYRVEQTETAQRAGAVQDTFEAGTGTEAYAAGNAEQDLNREMTNMISARNTYAANIAAVRVQDEISEETINLVG